MSGKKSQLSGRQTIMCKNFPDAQKMVGNADTLTGFFIRQVDFHNYWFWYFLVHVDLPYTEDLISHSRGVGSSVYTGITHQINEKIKYFQYHFSQETGSGNTWSFHLSGWKKQLCEFKLYIFLRKKIHHIFWSSQNEVRDPYWRGISAHRGSLPACSLQEHRRAFLRVEERGRLPLVPEGQSLACCKALGIVSQDFPRLGRRVGNPDICITN